MRIVNRKEFLSLPEETLFSKYEPCCFDPILIKGETWTNDFIFQSINDAIKWGDPEEFSDVLFKAEKTGESIDMDFNDTGRDGMFDEDQLFAVWEKKDLTQLIDRLNVALKAH